MPCDISLVWLSLWQSIAVAFLPLKSQLFVSAMRCHSIRASLHPLRVPGPGQQANPKSRLRSTESREPCEGQVTKFNLGGVAIEHVGPDPPERGQARASRFHENQN